MRNTRNSYLLLMLSLLAAMPANAILFDASVSPTTSSVSVEVRLTGDLPITDRFGRQVDDRTPLKDVLPKMPASALAIRVQPVTITWKFDCDPGRDTMSSLRGEYRADSRLLATTGPLSTPCATSASLPETLGFPAPIPNYLKEQFADVPVGDILSGRAISRTVPLTYTRTWKDTFVTSETVTASFILNSALRSNATLNHARLISVRGETRAANRNLPLSAGAPVNVPVDWVATVEVIGRGTPLTVSSQVIEFRTSDGQLLERVSKPLSQQALARVSRMDTRFAETVMVPSTVALQAR